LLQSRATSSVLIDNKLYSAGEMFQDPNIAELAEAAANGDIRWIDRLISAGANVNSKGRFEYTPVMWAIRTHSLKGFEHLLERGGRLDMSNNTALSAMSLAAGPAPSAKFLKVALSHGGNPNFVDSVNGETPMFQAVRSGDVERVAMLIDAGADLNIRAKGGLTALMVAALHFEYHSALLMLQHGADARIRTVYGKDFRSFVEQDQNRPFWMPSYWWRKKVVAFLGRLDSAK
jgi:ankyrin repeat protein